MDTLGYMARISAENGDCSDYRIAKLLGIAQTTMSAYRVGRRHADDEVAAKIANLLGMPPAAVIADLRATRAEAEGNTVMATIWRNVEALALGHAPVKVSPIKRAEVAAVAGRGAPLVAGAADAGMRKTRGRTMAGGKPAIGLGIDWGVYAKVVAGDGIEPPTRGFSIPCSTD